MKLKFKTNTDSWKQLFTSHKGKNALYSAVAIVVAIAIVVVVNLAAGQLPISVRQKDLSSEQIYSISDTSKEVISSLTGEVDVIALATNGTMDDRISNYLELYCDQSDYLKLTVIDTTRNPSALTEYDASANSVVVRNADTGKQEVISFDDILVYDMTSYYYYQKYVYTDFDAEGQLTSAVSLVTSDAAHVIYCETGHGESTMGSSVTELVSKNNLTTSKFSLLADGIPENCEMILFNQPTSDLSSDELSQLEEYLSGGGQVMILLDSNTQPDDFPNLNTLANQYGMNLLSGSLADQSNYYQYFGSAFVFFPTLSTSDDITSGIGSSQYVMVGYDGSSQVSPAIPMELVDPDISTVSTSAFLTTSDAGVAYVSQDNYQTGSFVLGAYGTDSETGARLTIISADTLISESLVSSFSSLANLQIFMNALTAGFEDMTTVSIASKSLTVTYNTVTNPTPWTLLFVIIIPLAVLICGFIHWMRRRKL